MKKIFCLLCLLFCVGVSQAATMCVPDLSTCESCTDFEVLHYTYSLVGKANCCGVPVVLLWGRYGDATVMDRSINIDVFSSVSHALEGMGFDVCMMVAPFVAPYAVVVGHGFAAGAYACAGFIPRCAFTYCDEKVYESADNPYL